MTDNTENTTEADALEAKWPDYLIQWRNGLWVSIREKESNVWKFITFYATAISLIIGLGQRLTNATDIPIDVSAVAAIVGLLTFWGLAIVIDSNFWLSRNLKLIGNIEKIFIPEEEYGKLIPGYYSSPLFRYARPYTVDFLFLIILGIIAYLNFLFHFNFTGQDWRQYLLPIMTALYVIGFYLIQRMDSYTRNEYDQFYKSAKGKPIAIGAELIPPEHLSFKLATNARFHHWAYLATGLIIISYGIKERAKITSRWISSIIILVLLLEFFYWLISRWLSLRLRETEEQHRGTKIEWETLRSERLDFKFKYETLRNFYTYFVAIFRGILLISLFLLIFLVYSQQLLQQI